MVRLGCFVTLLLIASRVSAQPINPVDDVSKVDPSGDDYPTCLPKVTPANANAFANKSVLFILGHGVEDHEIYYTHAYLTRRGATVQFLCPSSEFISSSTSPTQQVVLSDFFRPKYTVSCLSLSSLTATQFNSFSALYIPGGVPSSSSVRNDPALTARIHDYFFSPSLAAQGRLVATICSGSEVLIDSQIADIFPASQMITGSPATYWTWRNYLQSMNRSQSVWRGNDNGVDGAALAIPASLTHTKLVMGRNPDASQYFVLEFGRQFGGLVDNEALPLARNCDPSTAPAQQGDALLTAAGSSGGAGPQFYNHTQFRLIGSNQDLPVYAIPQAPSVDSLLRADLSGKQVVLAVCQGADAVTLNFLYSAFSQRGANVRVVCPSWIVIWKNKHIWLDSSPPAWTTHLATCSLSFTDLFNTLKTNHTAPDVLIVSHGLFSTNAVLRNDGELASLLIEMAERKGTVLGFVGTGPALFVPTAGKVLPLQSTVASTSFVTRDLREAGYTPCTWCTLQTTTNADGAVVVSSRGQPQDLKEFAEEIFRRVGQVPDRGRKRHWKIWVIVVPIVCVVAFSAGLFLFLRRRAAMRQATEPLLQNEGYA